MMSRVIFGLDDLFLSAWPLVAAGRGAKVSIPATPSRGGAQRVKHKRPVSRLVGSPCSTVSRGNNYRCAGGHQEDRTRVRVARLVPTHDTIVAGWRKLDSATKGCSNDHRGDDCRGDSHPRPRGVARGVSKRPENFSPTK